jgi:excisionase family DNA binding protein
MSPIENTAGNGVSLSPILVTIPQAAAMIGRGKTFIYGAISDGRIKAVKSGKRTLIVVESLRAYAASLPAVKIKPVPPRRPPRLR